MGLSVHYKGGRISDLEHMQDLHRDLIRFADESGWKYQDLTRPGEAHIVELMLDLHADCEPVFFLLIPMEDFIIHQQRLETLRRVYGAQLKQSMPAWKCTFRLLDCCGTFRNITSRIWRLLIRAGIGKPGTWKHYEPPGTLLRRRSIRWQTR